MDKEQRAKIKEFSKEILFLNPTEQVYLSKLWVRGLRGNYSLVRRIASVWLKSWHGRTKAEEWIEGRLEKDPGLTPKRLAYECRYYKKLSRELTPWLTYLARKVKNRLYKRRGYKPITADYAEALSVKGGEYEEEMQGVWDSSFVDDMEGERAGFYISVRVKGIAFPPPVLDFSSLRDMRERIMARARFCNLCIEEGRLVGEEELSRLRALFPIREFAVLVSLYKQDGGRYVYKEIPFVYINDLVKRGGEAEILSFQLIIPQKVSDLGRYSGNRKGVWFIFRDPGVRDVEVSCMTVGKRVFGKFSEAFETLKSSGCGVKREFRYRKRSQAVTVSEEALWVEFSGVIGARFFRKGRVYDVELEPRNLGEGVELKGGFLGMPRKGKPMM